MAWVRPGPAARWLTGEALAEVSVRLQDAARRPWPLERPGERRARAALARHAADYRVLEQAAAVPSQRLHAPFLDNQVVRACRALPGRCESRPGARADVLRDAPGAGRRPRPAAGLGRPLPVPPPPPPGRPARRPGPPARPLRRARCSPTRASSRPASSAPPCAPPPTATRSPWTGSPTSSPRRSGCAACSPAAAPAGPAPTPRSSAPSPRASSASRSERAPSTRRRRSPRLAAARRAVRPGRTTRRPYDAGPYEPGPYDPGCPTRPPQWNRPPQATRRTRTPKCPYGTT